MMRLICKFLVAAFCVFAVTNLLNAQTIVSVNPNTCQPGQHLAVLISGQATHFKSGSPTEVFFFTQGSPTQGSLTTSWFINDTLLLTELNIPADEPTGQRDIGVYNYIDGMLILEDAITITPYNPTITSITPGGAYPGRSLSVTISGQNTTFVAGSFIGGIFVPGSLTRTIVWFSQGSSSIYSKDGYVHGDNPVYATATVDIPEDAAPGLWDVHVPDMKEGTILTLPEGFQILQTGDWTGDGMVNFSDFAVLAEHWLAGNPTTFYTFSLDTNPGWATEGQWAFGQPTGNGGDYYGNPDPTAGYTGTNVYGVNLNGDYDEMVTGGPYYLTSNALNCSGYHGVHLALARWLNTDYPPYVDSKIEVSNDGANWSVIWAQQTGSPTIDSNWQILDYDISDIADRQATVYIRWSYEILDGLRANPYSGWNIDDIELYGVID